MDVNKTMRNKEITRGNKWENIYNSACKVYNPLDTPWTMNIGLQKYKTEQLTVKLIQDLI